MVAAVLNFLAVKKYTSFTLDLKLGVIKPFASAAIMAAFAYLAYWAAKHVLGNTLSTLAAIACGVVVYVVLVLLTGAIRLDELKKMLKRGK